MENGFLQGKKVREEFIVIGAIFQLLRSKGASKSPLSKHKKERSVEKFSYSGFKEIPSKRRGITSTQYLE